MAELIKQKVTVDNMDVMFALCMSSVQSSIHSRVLLVHYGIVGDMARGR
jgi:hypothetical protein